MREKSIGHHRMTLQDILMSWKSHFQHGVSSKSAASVQANERPFLLPGSVAPREVEHLMDEKASKYSE
jgi:hypothetical protein